MNGIIYRLRLRCTARKVLKILNHKKGHIFRRDGKEAYKDFYTTIYFNELTKAIKCNRSFILAACNLLSENKHIEFYKDERNNFIASIKGNEASLTAYKENFYTQANNKDVADTIRNNWLVVLIGILLPILTFIIGKCTSCPENKVLPSKSKTESTPPKASTGKCDTLEANTLQLKSKNHPDTLPL